MAFLVLQERADPVPNKSSGIMTKFDLETHPLINVQYTTNLYDSEDYVGLIKATRAVQAMEKNPKIGLFTNFNQGFVAVGLLYRDTPAEQPPAFALSYNLKSLMTTSIPSTNGSIVTCSRRAICTVTTKVSQELYEEVYIPGWRSARACQLALFCIIRSSRWAQLVYRQERIAGGSIMGLERVTHCCNSVSHAPHNDTHHNKPHRALIDGKADLMQNHRWVYTCEWLKDDSDDAAVQRAVDTSQKILRSYTVENVKKMLDAAAKYDPECVFQKLQHDGFLLRNNIRCPLIIEKPVKSLQSRPS
ncbi:hypothetical protein BGW36DRAFT_426282 [Talaromyces proteolyticus]|uniref:Uncharacterized protein n=1 Tax=Talaromyces proteolyticus TaxID=1131652 RepID=A0AAD4KST6_9EURO|nr:uncharacterized protein BGW36DRAFT_426282 [Talaromyces proteolyticus]KAH8698581.1 hypothetical protein BGW36DRAFT_426282 [Talaromyces proteolyticus]